MKIDVSGEALCLLDHFVQYASLYPERVAGAMHYDLNMFVRRSHCLEEAFHTAMYGLKQKKPVVGNKGQPLLPDDFEHRFPDPMGGKIREWLNYKTERRDFYSPIGLRNLLVQIENRAKKHSPELIADLISECMSNNWAGIIWDKIERQSSRRNGKRSMQLTGSEPSLWDSVLLGD